MFLRMALVTNRGQYVFVCVLCVLVYWCVRRYMQVFMHRSIRCCCVREEVFFLCVRVCPNPVGVCMSVSVCTYMRVCVCCHVPSAGPAVSLWGRTKPQASSTRSEMTASRPPLVDDRENTCG